MNFPIKRLKYKNVNRNYTMKIIQKIEFESQIDNKPENIEAFFKEIHSAKSIVGDLSNFSLSIKGVEYTNLSSAIYDIAKKYHPPKENIYDSPILQSAKNNKALSSPIEISLTKEIPSNEILKGLDWDKISAELERTTGYSQSSSLKQTHEAIAKLYPEVLEDVVKIKLNLPQDHHVLKADTLKFFSSEIKDSLTNFFNDSEVLKTLKSKDNIAFLLESKNRPTAQTQLPVKENYKPALITFLEVFQENASIQQHIYSFMGGVKDAQQILSKYMMRNPQASSAITTFSQKSGVSIGKKSKLKAEEYLTVCEIVKTGEWESIQRAFDDLSDIKSVLKEGYNCRLDNVLLYSPNKETTQKILEHYPDWFSLDDYKFFDINDTYRKSSKLAPFIESLPLFPKEFIQKNMPNLVDLYSSSSPKNLDNLFKTTHKMGVSINDFDLSGIFVTKDSSTFAAKERNPTSEEAQNLKFTFTTAVENGYDNSKIDLLIANIVDKKNKKLVTAYKKEGLIKTTSNEFFNGLGKNMNLGSMFSPYMEKMTFDEKTLNYQNKDGSKLWWSMIERNLFNSVKSFNDRSPGVLEISNIPGKLDFLSTLAFSIETINDTIGSGSYSDKEKAFNEGLDFAIEVAKKTNSKIYISDEIVKKGNSIIEHLMQNIDGKIQQGVFKKILQNYDIFIIDWENKLSKINSSGLNPIDAMISKSSDSPYKDMTHLSQSERDLVKHIKMFLGSGNPESLDSSMMRVCFNTKSKFGENGLTAILDTIKHLNPNELKAIEHIESFLQEDYMLKKTQQIIKNNEGSDDLNSSHQMSFKL